MIHSDFLYSGTYQWLFSPSHRFQLSINNAAKVLPLIYDSNWYTILPRHLIQKSLDEGSLIEIPILDGQIPPVDYYLMYQKEHQNIALDCFIKDIMSPRDGVCDSFFTWNAFIP